MWSLIATLGSFVPGLFGRKLTFKTAKIVGALMLVGLTVAILSIGKCSYDRSVIAQHEAEVDTAAAKLELEADRAADADNEKLRQEFANSQERLEKATAEAERADPANAGKSVGPVTQSYFDNLPKKGHR